MKVTDQTAHALTVLTAMRIRFLEKLRYAVMFYRVKQYETAMIYHFNALALYDEYLDVCRKYGDEGTAAFEYHLLGWE